MRFPSIFVSAVIVGVLAVLQHLLLHVGDFHLPELYAPIIVAVLTALVKMVQEWQTPEPTLTGQTAAARGEGEAQASYLARVLYK